MRGISSVNTKNFLPLEFRLENFVFIFLAASFLLSSFIIISPVNAGTDYHRLTFKPIPLSKIAELENDGFDGGLAIAINSRNSQKDRNVFNFNKFLSTTRKTNSELDVDYSQLIEKQLKDLEEHMADEGPYGQLLQNDLNKLAMLYQDAGRNSDAKNTLERALQISKINKGLFHEEQIPLVEAYVQNLLALGDYSGVNEQLDFLVYLNQKCFGFDSPELIKPLADKVAWDMFLLNSTSINNGNNSTNAIDANALINNFSSPYQASSQYPGILVQTQETIVKAIQILVNARDFANPFLFDFEQQLIATYFYQARQSGMANSSEHLVTNLQGTYISHDPFDFTMSNYLNGKQAYQRLLGYMERNGQGASFDYVLASIGLGDWYTLFGKRLEGLQQYEKIQTILQGGDFSEEEKQVLMNPEIPSSLPAFSSSPFAPSTDFDSADSGNIYKGYIDVAFEISRFGRAKNFQTLGSSAQTPRDILTKLEWKIRDTQFRPLVKSENASDNHPVQLRYYYNY